jgi:predicted ribosome quality control (RQC) complex YloA/Tae2 family protein
MPGSHVVARHEDRPSRCPRDVRRVAAGLAAWFSKARDGGMCSVHWTQWSQVYKKQGAPAGQVCLKKYESMQVRPKNPDLI